jgi:hypothetical protein
MRAMRAESFTARLFVAEGGAGGGSRSATTARGPSRSDPFGPGRLLANRVMIVPLNSPN